MVNHFLLSMIVNSTKRLLQRPIGLMLMQMELWLIIFFYL
jgi:hypothetical protein